MLIRLPEVSPLAHESRISHTSLQGLPAELRLTIWRHIVTGSNAQIQLVETDDGTAPHDHLNKSYHFVIAFCESTQLFQPHPLLYVKAFKNEFRALFLQEVVFNLPASLIDHYDTRLETPNFFQPPPALTAHVQRLQLTVRELLKFFPPTYPTINDYNTANRHEICIPALPALKYLELTLDISSVLCYGKFVQVELITMTRFAYFATAFELKLLVSGQSRWLDFFAGTIVNQHLMVSCQPHAKNGPALGVRVQQVLCLNEQKEEIEGRVLKNRLENIDSTSPYDKITYIWTGNGWK